MANLGSAISLSQLSQASDEESSEHSSRSLATLSGGASCIIGGVTGSPSIAPHKKSPPSAAGFCILGNNLTDNQSVPALKKPRGRPPGSKNKPKPAVFITREDDQALKPVIIHISAGSDVVDSLIQFAHHRQVGLTVLSGSGSVTNVTLRHPVSHAPSFTLHGTFTLLSLSGTYINSPLPPPPPPSSSSSHSSIPPSSISSLSFPACLSFGICLAGTQGQVFGGVVAGKLIAAGVVVVVASLYKNPVFHRLSNTENDDAEDTELSAGCGGGGNANAAEGGGANNSAAMVAISGFSVVSPSPLNCNVPTADVNMMNWSHHNIRPHNY